MVYKELTEEMVDEILTKDISNDTGKDCLWVLVDSDECPQEMRRSKWFGDLEPKDGNEDNHSWDNWRYYSQEIDGKTFVNFMSRNVSGDINTGGYDLELAGDITTISMRIMIAGRYFGTGNIYVTSELPKTEVI